MPGITKTWEPGVVILPEDTTSQKKDTRRRTKKPRLLTVLLSLLALIALFHFIAVMHSADPVATPINCLGLLRTTDFTKMVHLQAKTQEMEALQFVDQVDGGQPAVLLQVMNTGSQHALDVYMYGCTMQKQGPKLATLFMQRGLIQGTVTVSSANTLITGELDTTLPPQAATLGQALQQNVYREYSWQQGRLVQVVFAGLYPVTSRSEAEALQQQADNGQAGPWNDPLMTAEQMAKDIFKWSAISPQDAVLNNDGITAHVQLIQQSPQLQVTVTLQRLVQHDNKGLWFVTGAQTRDITSDQLQASRVVTSPMTVQGTGALADGQTTATLFDHTLTPLTILNNPTPSVGANGAYNGMLFYTNGVQNQPGLLLIESLPHNGSSEMGRLL